MSQITQINNPPRYPTQPMAPLPQTVMGVLEHSGLPMSEPEQVTDIPPDFSWMSMMQYYTGMFEMKNTDAPGSQLYKFHVNLLHDNGIPGFDPESYGNLDSLDFVPWTIAPSMFSRWFNGTVAVKLIAIKPPRVTGKILIRFAWNPKQDWDEADAKRRDIAKEWDLGETGECEFDIPAMNPIRARPTWLPRITSSDLAANSDDGSYVSQVMPYPSWYMGQVRIEVATRLQPGSIFPDRIRILVFRSLKNAIYYQPTDPRSTGPHIFAKGPEDLSKPTPK